MPYVSVRVTDDKCTSSEDSLFVRTWGGTEQGCLVNKIDGVFGYSTKQVVMTQVEYDDYIRTSRSGKNNNQWQARNREPCVAISMKPAKEQDEFYDMRFCGTRGGQSFLKAQRPEPMDDNSGTYECPTNFVACSADTSPDNTICVSTAKKDTDCPLTTAKFVKAADYSTATYPDADYEAFEVNDDYKFVVSKTKGDNLPLSSFKVEYKPCLDHRDVSRATNAVFYPLEADRLIDDC